MHWAVVFLAAEPKNKQAHRNWPLYIRRPNADQTTASLSHSPPGTLRRPPTYLAAWEYLCPSLPEGMNRPGFKQGRDIGRFQQPSQGPSQTVNLVPRGQYEFYMDSSGGKLGVIVDRHPNSSSTAPAAQGHD